MPVQFDLLLSQMHNYWFIMFVGFRVKSVETTIHFGTSTKPVGVERFDLSDFHREKKKNLPAWKVDVIWENKSFSFFEWNDAWLV